NDIGNVESWPTEELSAASPVMGLRRRTYSPASTKPKSRCRPRSLNSTNTSNESWTSMSPKPWRPDWRDKDDHHSTNSDTIAPIDVRQRSRHLRGSES